MSALLEIAMEGDGGGRWGVGKVAMLVVGVAV